MAEDERQCVVCQDIHAAAAWYERIAADGKREYVCGVEYWKARDKVGWVQVFPRDD